MFGHVVATASLGSYDTDRAGGLLEGTVVARSLDEGLDAYGRCVVAIQKAKEISMLKDEIDDAKRSVSTDTVQITIGEISNMYGAEELNILPDFQRLFRWTVDRKSNFIESIFIGIPVPPVFAYENEAALGK